MYALVGVLLKWLTGVFEVSSALCVTHICICVYFLKCTAHLSVDPFHSSIQHMYACHTKITQFILFVSNMLHLFKHAMFQQAMAISCRLNTKNGICALNMRSSSLCWWRWCVLPNQLINWHDGDHLWAPMNTVMMCQKWQQIHTFNAKVQKCFTFTYQWINIHRFTPIQNNMQHQSYVYFNLSDFGCNTAQIT